MYQSALVSNRFLRWLTEQFVAFHVSPSACQASKQQIEKATSCFRAQKEKGEWQVGSNGKRPNWNTSRIPSGLLAQRNRCSGQKQYERFIILWWIMPQFILHLQTEIWLRIEDMNICVCHSTPRFWILSKNYGQHQSVIHTRTIVNRNISRVLIKCHNKMSSSCYRISH